VGQTVTAKADPSAPPHVETDGQILVDAVLGRFARRTLPKVEAPKVDGSAGVIPQAVEALAPMSNEMASEEGTKPVGAAAPRPSRYALPTAGLALAAVLGSFVGSLSPVGFVQLWPEAPASAMTDAGALQAHHHQVTAKAQMRIDGIVQFLLPENPRWRELTTHLARRGIDNIRANSARRALKSANGRRHMNRCRGRSEDGNGTQHC
jgi:hypothetical protein